VNGEFLCIKGRYGFDFYDHPERLQAPLLRTNGKLEEVSWSRALGAVAARFRQTVADGGSVGVIGSNHTTNEENYYLAKFAREILKTGNIDHHRTGDVATLVDALSGKSGKLATVADLYERKAALVLGADLALEHPLLAYQLRANSRHHKAHIYTVTEGPVREDQYAVASLRGRDYEPLREKLKAEPELVIVFGDSYKGDEIRKLVEFGESLGIPVSYICLVDYSNSRGALDMGLVPAAGGLRIPEMLAEELAVLWVVGSNPLKPAAAGQAPANRKCGFLVVQDMFLTETAQQADVVLPAACAYEKNGTITNVSGEVQRLKRAVSTMGAKPDLEIMGFIAREMGMAAAVGPWTPEAVFEEIRKNIHGYEISLPAIELGGAAQTMPVNGRIPVENRPDLVHSDHNGLFTSGTLGRYSKVLKSVMESR
jgi:NADH-quinone oxidoreductase subunit G